MAERNFHELIQARWDSGHFVCVGLDTDFVKVPECMRGVTVRQTVVSFNRHIVQATADLVCAYKLNFAYYIKHGEDGLAALKQTIISINSLAPAIPVILDVKCQDVKSTNEAYAEAYFDDLGADAITIHNYLGEHDSVEPFLGRKEKGIFVLCRTSNEGGGEFQDLLVEIDEEEGKFLSKVGAYVRNSNGGYFTKLYLHVAYRVTFHWNGNKNCGLVVGSTYPDASAFVRSLDDQMPLLNPAIGEQRGNLAATVRAAKNKNGQGMIIGSSRGIIYASSKADFAERARGETEKLHDAINSYLKEEVDT